MHTWLAVQLGSRCALCASPNFNAPTRLWQRYIRWRCINSWELKTQLKLMCKLAKIFSKQSVFGQHNFVADMPELMTCVCFSELNAAAGFGRSRDLPVGLSKYVNFQPALVTNFICNLFCFCRITQLGFI